MVGCDSQLVGDRFSGEQSSRGRAVSACGRQHHVGRHPTLPAALHARHRCPQIASTVNSRSNSCGAGQAGGAQSDALPLPLDPFVELKQAAPQERAVGGGGGGGGKNRVPSGSRGEIR